MVSSKKNFSKFEYDDDTVSYSDNKKYLICGPMIVKSFVIIFNILFIISGVLLTLFGVWTLMYKQEYVQLLSSMFYQASTYILIVAGGFIVITGILGIVSAWIENKKLLILFIVLMVFVFLFEISAGILAFAYRAKLNQSLKYDLEMLIFNEYNQTTYEEKTRLFDDLQIKFKCCGANDFQDWSQSLFVKNQNILDSREKNKEFNLVAESCCKTPSKFCAKRTHPSNINYQGCVLALEKYISQHIILLGVVGLSSFLFQSVGLFLTALLLRRIKQKTSYDSIKTEEN